MGANEPVHLHDDDLDLYVAGRLAEPESSAIHTHVTGCEVCARRLAKAVEFMLRLAAQNRQEPRVALSDRRQEPRMPTDDPGSMRVLHPLVGDWASVQILDASRGGTRVRTGAYVAAGTLVQLRIKDSVALGEIRYCVPAGDAFHAGIQIQDLQ
jgi:anti-sigma factor RsiW